MRIFFNKNFKQSNIKYQNTKYYLVFAFVVFLFTYLPFFLITGDLNYLPLGSNEASHLNVARSVFNGSPPYIEHFDARGPLTFYILSISFLFKNFLLGFHLLYFFITLISCFVSYKICQHLYNKQSALFAFLISALLLTQSNHPENLAFLFISIFIYFSFCQINKNKIIYPILSGLFMSCAVLIRFNISILAIFGCLYFLFQKKNKWRFLFAYIIGGLIPLFLILFIYITHENGLKIFLNATLFYHLELTQGRPFYIGIYQLLELLISLPWISLFIISIFSFLFDNKFKKESFFLLSFLVVSIFSTLLARKFNPHYLLVSAPFLIVLGSSLINKNILLANKIIKLIFLIILMPLLINNFYLKAQNFYKPNNFPFFLSNLLTNHVENNDKIFSSLNGLYLYMNKKNYLRIVDSSHFERAYNYKSLYGESITFIDEFKEALRFKPKFLVIDDYVKQMHIYNDIKELIKDDYKLYKFYDEKEIAHYRNNYRNLLKTTTVYVLKNNLN
jgi:hypothetical protein